MTSTTPLKQTEMFAFVALALLVILLFVAVDRSRLLEEQRQTPPIIVLSEKEQSYRFELGSAEISAAFERRLRNRIVPLLDSLSRQYEADVVEVIGHTDAVPVNSQSTLDRTLLKAFEEETSGDTMRVSPGSNVDLGIMRALTITRYLQSSKSAGRLSKISRFVPYSAGQVVLPDGSVASSEDSALDPARRRIEIRLRRAKDYRRTTVEQDSERRTESVE